MSLNTRKRSYSAHNGRFDGSTFEAFHGIKRKRSSFLLLLSDELILRILSLLSVKQLLNIQRVCHRLYNLAGDDHIWYAAYAQAFTDHQNRLNLRNTAQPVDREPAVNHFYNQSNIRWKSRYKIQHRWSSGYCKVNHVLLANTQSDTSSMIYVFDDILFTAGQNSGLRIWKTDRNSAFVQSHIKLEYAISASTAPSAIAVSRSSKYLDILSIAIGFKDGKVLLYSYAESTATLSEEFVLSSNEESEIVSLAMNGPFIAVMTVLARLELHYIEYCHGADENHSMEVKCLATVKSSTAWTPIDLSIRVSSVVIVSVAYTMPAYTSYWTINVQEWTFDPALGLRKRRQHEKPLDLSGEASHLSMIRYSDSVLPIRPNILAYSHPYLLAACPDNTISLFKVDETKDRRTIPLVTRLVGHSTSIGALKVKQDGKAVSVSSDGSDIRIWNLEACAAEAQGSLVRQPVVKLQLLSDRSDKMFTAENLLQLKDWDNERSKKDLWVTFTDRLLLLFAGRGSGGQDTLTIHDFA